MKDRVPVIARHKGVAGQWASQWRAPVESGTMAVHAGNWAGRYKGLEAFIGAVEDRHSEKEEVFVWALSIKPFPMRKNNSN